MAETGSFYDLLGFLLNQGQSPPFEQFIMGYKRVEINGVHGQINTVEQLTQETTNAYADAVDTTIDARLASVVVYTFKNGAAALKYKILGSLKDDFSDAVEVVAEQTLNTSTNGSQTLNPAPFSYYKVQIKASVADSQTTPEIRGAAK